MGPRLRIVAINDVYTLENLPRLKTLIAHHRAIDPADLTLVTLAGDFVAPSVLSSLDNGRGMVDCLNSVGVTHLILGNHEDDIATEELHSRLAESNACAIGTNLPSFDSKMRRSDCVQVHQPGGRIVRVGLVGVVMTDRSIYRRDPFGGASLEDANDSARREAARLMSEEKCAVVIPLTHQTIEEDRALAVRQRQPPFPVIIGGHEHQVTLLQVEGSWIAKAGADAVHAAIIDLTWPEAEPRANEFDFPIVTVRMDDTSHYTEDHDLRLRVNQHMAKVKELEGATLALLPPGQVLSSIGTRIRQTSLGQLLATRIRDSLGADVGLVNGGGIRGSREYRERFTYGDLKAEVPFDNELVVVRMPGTVLSNAIRDSRANAPNESGGFLQVDDSIELDEKNQIVRVNGRAFEAERDYCVALVRNLLTGLDRIPALAQFGRDYAERVPPSGSGQEIKIVLVNAFATELWHHLGTFAAIDTDGDGQINGREISSAVAKMHENTDKKMNKMPASAVTTGLILQAVDQDHDGTISRDEAERAGRKSHR